MCDASGYLSLIDSTNGETLDRTALGSNIEASPVVYNNTIVVGAKGAQIFAITIS
jgi:hypothetical protein